MQEILNLSWIYDPQILNNVLIIIAILSILIELLIIYIHWLFIKSAVREGVKEALSECFYEWGYLEKKDEPTITFEYID